MKHFSLKHLKQLLLIALLSLVSTSYAQTWVPVYSNSLSTDEDMLEINDPLYCTFPMQNSSIQTFNMNLSQIEPGKKNIAQMVYGRNENRNFAVKVKIEPGTYKFSYRMMSGKGINASVNFFYTSSLPSSSNNKIVLLNGQTSNNAINLESESFNITEAGEYYFGFYVTGCLTPGYFFFADFQLFMIGEPAETFPVTVADNLQNGSLALTVDGKPVAGEVEKGKTVNVEATPEKGYRLETITYTVDEETAQDITDAKSFEVTGATVVAATFTAIPTYQVTWNEPEHGTIVVKNGSEILSSPATVEENTVITIEATPENGYELTSLMAGEADILEYKQITITENTDIVATFEVATPKTREVTWSKSGKQAWWGVLDIYVDDVNLVHDEGNGGGKLNITDGQTVKIATSIPADKGVATVTVGGEKVELDADGNYTFTMSATTTSINVVFDQPQVKVEINKTGEGELTVTVENTTFSANTTINKGAEFTVNAVPAQGHKLESLEVLIGGVAATGDKFIATDDVVINATFVEKTISTYTVTVEKPEHGDLAISYEVNGETANIYTSEFEESSKTFDIEENTVISISANPEFDYELDEIFPEGMEEKVGLQGTIYYEHTLTADVTIKATFKPIQYGAVTIEQPDEKEGKISVEFFDSMMDSWYDASWMLDRIEYGTELRFIVEAAEGYEVKEVKKNDEVLKADAKDGHYHVTVNEETINISAVFNPTSGIDNVDAENVYYNKADESIYTNNAKAVKVYDLSGRLVLNAANQTVVNVSELADGFYTAVVDGTVIKFNK